MPEDPLERLLDRCHRDELLPLARITGIKAEGVGMADLAARVARAVRASGSHELATAFRRGRALPYSEVVADAARRRGIPVGDLEDNEVAIVRSFFAKQWDEKSDAEREVQWSRWRIALPVPKSGADALSRAGSALGRRLDYAIAQTHTLAENPVASNIALLAMASPLGCLLRPFVLLYLPVMVWQMRPRYERVDAAVVEIARLRQVVRHRVTVGIVGSPSTGKDAAIKALFGLDSGNISPIAGSTREVSIQQVPGATALYLVNTPGMGDVVERVTEEAKQILDHIDLYIYVVNAEGGVQAREKADYDRCRASGRPVLAVVNKIDVLRPRDKERYLADARAKLGASEADFAAVAFDPMPELAPGPIGLEVVHVWLSARLADLGKDPAELPPLPAPPAQ
jgi:small GTP-binding protein